MGYDDPSCTVFVKNVEARVTEEILWELFLQAGPLRSIKIPTDRETGDRRNFAFVTYKEDISVKYACELFNQIKLFKKPIYCNPSDRGNRNNSSITQSPQSSPQSPTSANTSLIQGILNRGSSVPPNTSTPLHGKRKISIDNDSRVVIVDDDSDRERFDDRGSSDRGSMYRGSGGRDGARYNGHDDRRGPNDRSFNERGDRSFNDRGDHGNDRSRGYERSNSYNSSYGSPSPMHMHAMNQSHRQYGRPGNSPRGGGGGGDFGRSPRGGGGGGYPRGGGGGGDSGFGGMRQQQNVRRQRSQPY